MVHILIAFIRGAPTFLRVTLSLSTSLRMLSIFMAGSYKKSRACARSKIDTSKDFVSTGQGNRRAAWSYA